MEKKNKIILGIIIAIVLVVAVNTWFQNTLNHNVGNRYAMGELIGEVSFPLTEDKILNEVKKFENNSHGVEHIEFYRESNNFIEYNLFNKNNTNIGRIIVSKDTGGIKEEFLTKEYIN